ncbi:hypothetical protein ACQR16_02740 [Bradyrhizobium oligotrophicum]|uniref:hypothetical protein n=1 Tax=Bradyrhizobium oligotrophicum TaxID=44255 RepID=UPI003EC0D7EB
MTCHLNALPGLKSLPKLGAAAVLLTISLATPPAQANSLKGSDGDMVNGQYCNELCKVYMAWSDRMLAITQPNYSRPQVRVAVPQSMSPKKMDKIEKAERPEPRITPHAPKTQRPASLDSYAQLPSGSHAAQAAMDGPGGGDIAADDRAARMGQLYGTEPVPPRSALAEMRRAASETADMRLVSMTDPGMARGSTTVGEAGGSARSKMPSIWILLAAAAILAFFGHGWLKRRNGGSEGIG